MSTVVAVERNQIFNVSCTSEGNPPPNVTLQKRTGKTTWVTADETFESTKGDVWTFLYNISRETFSDLKCVATNRIGDVGESNVITLYTKGMN